MGTSPATRKDSWAQASLIAGMLAIIGGLVISGEHRLTVIETNTGQMTTLAQSAAVASKEADSTSKEAYEISKLSARGTLIILEILHGQPSARAKRKEMEEVMSALKAKKVSEIDHSLDAGGAMTAPRN